MPSEKSKYSEFYLMGFEAMSEDGVDEVDLEDVDLSPAIDKVTEGADVYEVAMDIAKKVMAPLHLTDRSFFAEEHGPDIKESTLDESKAFDAWMTGRTDELRRTVEYQILEGMLEDAGEEDEEDDEEENDEEGDED